MAAVAAVGAFVKSYGSYIALAGSAVSAYTQYQSGQMQATGMNLQAAQAELQRRQTALNLCRQAVNVLRRQEQLAASVRARAASGGVDPFTGSPLTIQQIDSLMAQEEVDIAKQNAEIAVYGGLAQSQSLQSAASSTQFMSGLGALGSLARGVGQFSDIALPRTTQAPAPVREAIPVSVG